MKSLPTLYSRTSTGAVQTWTIYYNQDSYWTVYGQVDGKKTTTSPYKAYATNEGRANARTAAEQAEFEAKALWKKRVDSGYFESIDQIDDDYYIEPMLAKNWDDRKDKVKYPVFEQRKYDGARCVVSAKGGFSRNGKPWKTINHITSTLAPVFEKYPDIVFDGELYNHELHDDFEKIMSLVKKTKPTAEDLEESAQKVQYWVYDIVDTSLKFSERQAKLKKIVNEYLNDAVCVVIVPTTVCRNEQELTAQYEKHLADGFEGQMIRLDTPYENKRSANLLKRKEFMDSEFEIISINKGEGNKSTVAGNMTLKTDAGVIFNSNIKGPYEYLEKLYGMREEFTGKYATVKFFGIGAHGAPRFPYVIKIRDGKGVD